LRRQIGPQPMTDRGVDLGLREQRLVGGADAHHSGGDLDQALLDPHHRSETLEQGDHVALDLGRNPRSRCVTHDSAPHLDRRVGHQPEHRNARVSAL
jgi:hypothetical protein